MSDSDTARLAAVEQALTFVEPGMTIGLGSGRAVFALAGAIGKRWPGAVPVRATAASNHTAEVAHEAGIKLVDLGPHKLDIALDGADEFDDQLRLVKGGGAALLQEKLIIAQA